MSDKPSKSTESDEMEAIIDASEETNEKIQEYANQKDVILLSFIGTYFARRYNPSTSALASINVRDEFGIEKILTEIQQKVPKCKEKKMYMLVNSTGGTLTSAYKTARTIRDCFDDITVFVPHYALSGGTLLALTGNRIKMGMMSQLSPLDVQVYHEPQGQQVSVNSLFKAQTTLNEIFSTSKAEELPYTYKYMAESLDPIMIEEWLGVQKEGQHYLREILQKSGYADIENLIQTLTLRFPTHGFVIHHDNAKEIGIKVEKHDTDLEAWNLMRFWLSKYITQQTDRHFLRYAVPKKSDSTQKTQKK
ncbi:MAG TPA: hypothetical protein VJ571_06025 [Candidatus Nitrosotalea sp.]|nr:hypothetical protein [Candidatus Nitrosotalea sp.]